MRMSPFEGSSSSRGLADRLSGVAIPPRLYAICLSLGPSVLFFLPAPDLFFPRFVVSEALGANC